MRILIAAFALCLGATAVQAAEGAVPSQGNVVEFDVLAVGAPPSLSGLCAVTGVTTRVWQGHAYRAGQPLFLTVPCAEYGLIPVHVRMDGIVPVNVRSLQQSLHGIARLGDKGELLWQDYSGRSYGAWGQVVGYRVLDPRMLPVTPS